MILIAKRPVGSNRTNIALIAMLMSAAMLGGCSGDKEKTSQVMVKVNSEEITVSQVNAALVGLPYIPGKTMDEAKKEVLENLIIQKLAVQQALKMKMDRTPKVMQTIETAKNTILARAYMDPIVSGVPKPTPLEIHKYYVDHPELFSNRQVFTLRELEMAKKPDLAASIRDKVGKGESLEVIATWLKEKDIPSAIQTGVKPAEQIPLELLTRISKLPAHQLLVIELVDSISVLQVVSARTEPVEESVASAAIQEYMLNARKKEALEKEMKVLKAAAKIEYVSQPEAKPVAAAKDAIASQPAQVDVAKGVADLK